MNEEIKIRIYDDKGAVSKEVSARPLDLKFGSIRKLMQILNIEKAGNTYDLFKVVYEAWDEITGILGECFPEITPEEWDGVKIKELMPAIVQIARDTLSDIMTIPTDKKNA